MKNIIKKILSEETGNKVIKNYVTKMWKKQQDSGEIPRINYIELRKRNLDKNIDTYNNNYIIIKTISYIMQKYIEFMPIDEYRNYKYYKLPIYISSALTFIPLYIAKKLIIKIIKDSNQNEL